MTTPLKAYAMVKITLGSILLFTLGFSLGLFVWVMI